MLSRIILMRGRGRGTSHPAGRGQNFPAGRGRNTDREGARFFDGGGPPRYDSVQQGRGGSQFDDPATRKMEKIMRLMEVYDFDYQIQKEDLHLVSLPAHLKECGELCKETFA